MGQLTRVTDWIYGAARAVGRGIVRLQADLTVLAGILLVGVGVWQMSAGAALITVGALLLWLALPSRPFFIEFKRSKESK